MADPTATGTASEWLSRIDAAIRREDKWRDRAKKVVRRYRDERGRRDDSKINILWANTEVLKASLFARMPRPDVRRRFPDAAKQNSASRVAAEVIERSITYVVDVERVDQSVSTAVDDVLLPGRGTVWISYEPEIEEANEAASEGEGALGNGALLPPARPGGTRPGGNGYSASPTAADTDQEYGVENEETDPATGTIVSQTLCVDYVYWEDYCQGVARQDRDVPWKARRHVMRKDEFEAKFPDAKSAPTASYELKDADGQRETDDTDQSSRSFIEVWEIWDKAGGRKRVYVGRGYPDILQSDDDPYNLSSFFPTPKPLYSVVTTDKNEPIPEFLQYQDQAIELDDMSTRIKKLIQQLRYRGIYDASADGENVLAALPNADDGEFLPYSNWGQLKDKGGIENAVGFWPVEMLVNVLKELYVQRQSLIQGIYEITGISDIIRGSTDPNETKGAQVLKARFGSMRMQKRQREVDRFVRDIYSLLGEMVAEHFTQETLADITGFDLPTKAEQMQLQAQIAPPAPPPMPMGPAAPMAAPADVLPPQAGQPPLPAGAPSPLAPPVLPTIAQPPPPANGFTAGTPIPRGALPTLNAPPPKIPPEISERLRSPAWEDVIDILRSDKLRGYRVDIETDTSAMEDAATEQQGRIEFVAAFQKMLEGAYTAAVQAPTMLPLIKESALFLVRSYKAGRTLEQALEDAFDDLAGNPPPPPQDKTAPSTTEDPQVKQMEIAARHAENQGRIQLENQKLLADASNTSGKIQADLALNKAKLAMDEQRLQADQAKTAAGTVADQQAMLLEMRKLAADIQLEHAKITATLAGKKMQAARPPTAVQPAN